MSEKKTIYRMSELLGSGRETAGRLAIIHFAAMTEEEQRSELEAVRSKNGSQKLLKFLEDIIALDPRDRRNLVSQLREDFLEDTLSGRL